MTTQTDRRPPTPFPNEARHTITRIEFSNESDSTVTEETTWRVTGLEMDEFLAAIEAKTGRPIPIG